MWSLMIARGCFGFVASLLIGAGLAGAKGEIDSSSIWVLILIAVIAVGSVGAIALFYFAPKRRREYLLAFELLDALKP